jgi:uncharacterized protein
LSATARRASGPQRYADASALVKLILDEPESGELDDYVGSAAGLVTSRLAVVEVTRAAKIASSDPAVLEEVAFLLAACQVMEVTSEILQGAARLASLRLRTLDAIHLASIVRVEPDEVLTYDRRLVAAARDLDYRVVHPGAEL